MRVVLYVVLNWMISSLHCVRHTENVCEDAVRRCQYGTNSSSTLRTEGVGEPLVSDVNGFSQLIRYKHANRSVQGPIKVDTDFLSAVEILYNNEQQLRALLTLIKSEGSPAWVRFVQSYDDCAGRSAIFTCIRSTCREYDLTRLRYVSTIFTENVVGFQLREKPFELHVIIGLWNKYTRSHKTVRVNASHIYMFDAVFNAIKHFLLLHQMGDAPLLKRLDAFNRNIGEYRDKSLRLVVRP